MSTAMNWDTNERMDRMSGPKNADQFTRGCYYWANIQNRILNDLKGRDYLSLSFKDLINGRINELEKFIGKTLPQKITSPAHKSKVIKYKDYNNWSATEKRIFWEICGKPMTELGYI